MSRPDLHKTDYPVLGSPDSEPVLSEPPDIRNWFSSYAYASPELNTLDGLQDFHGSGETCLHEGNKSGENRVVDESVDGLLSAGRNSLPKAINCEKTDELEYIKSSALVAESSESLSFSSEPPDIKNWFSSYFYEASPLDTTHDFTVSGYKESGDDGLYNAQRNSKNDKYDVIDSIDVKGGIELPTKSIASPVVVKCTNLFKDSKLNHKPLDKDATNGSLKPMSSMHSPSTYEKVSQQTSPGKRTGNWEPGITQKHGDTNTYDKDGDMKSDSGLFQKSTGSEDRNENGLQTEDLRTIPSPDTFDLTLSKDSSRRHANKRRIGKENKESELCENGFVSVTKSRQENVGNLPRPGQFQFESGHGVKPAMRSEKTGNPRRKVLSETSNFLSPKLESTGKWRKVQVLSETSVSLSPGVLESTGKWRCPQKSKPDFGPPLKQLRMEKWVRRV